MVAVQAKADVKACNTHGESALSFALADDSAVKVLLLEVPAICHRLPSQRSLSSFSFPYHIFSHSMGCAAALALHRFDRFFGRLGPTL